MLNVPWKKIAGSRDKSFTSFDNLRITLTEQLSVKFVKLIFSRV
jgi:hypothetical protein